LTLYNALRNFISEEAGRCLSVFLDLIERQSALRDVLERRASQYLDQERLERMIEAPLPEEGWDPLGQARKEVERRANIVRTVSGALTQVVELAEAVGTTGMQDLIARQGAESVIDRQRNGETPGLRGLACWHDANGARKVVGELEQIGERRGLPRMAMQALRSVPPDADETFVALVLSGRKQPYLKALAEMRQRRDLPGWIVDEGGA